MAVPNTSGWQAYILRKLGAPPTAENLRFLNAWAQAEGGSASNNPFNTTQPGFGATSSYNSVGVKNYSNPQGGLDATVATLQNGRYGPILSALRRGNSAMADAQAEAMTPWGTGSLIEKVLGGPVTGGQPTAGGGGSVSHPMGQQFTTVRPNLKQHIVANRVNVLGSSLAATLYSNAQELLSGGSPNLSNLFTLAKGFQKARGQVNLAPPRMAPLGGTPLALNAATGSEPVGTTTELGRPTQGPKTTDSLRNPLTAK